MKTLRSFSFLALATLAGPLAACDADVPESDLTDIDTGDVDDEALGQTEDELGGGHHFKNPLVLQDSPARVKKYERLTRRWLRWAMELPWSTGPITDTTGAACADGQEGNVWFLAGTEEGPVTRACTVPEGARLFFPLRNLWSIPPAHLVDEPAELANFVAFFTDLFPQDRAETCGLTLRLDGRDLLPDFATMDEALWVQILDPFRVYVNPSDNWAGYAGGQMPAALVDGHYALLKPLRPGNHTLELGGAQCDLETGEVYFETSAVYELHVEEDTCH